MDGAWSWGPGRSLYDRPGSLPRAPAALDGYLARLSYPNTDATQATKDVADFFATEELQSSAVLSPALDAELYRAAPGTVTR